MTPPRQSDGFSTIVLCGGPLNPTNLPIGAKASNAMVPVNGKPVIAWILDDLIRKAAGDVVVVLRQEHERLRAFLERSYDSRLPLRLAVVGSTGSILNSLQAGLQTIEGDAVRVVLGDTLITDPFDDPGDVVYVGEVEESQRWCVLKVDGADRIVAYHDKQNLPGASHFAAAGCYTFADVPHLRLCVAEALSEGARELSDVLARYGRRHPISVRHTTGWHDFGHIDNFTRAKSSLLQTRFFNTLRVDPVLNTITKISTNHEKLEDEVLWYRSIPEELKVLTPRIVSQRRVNGSTEIVQEYYGYPTLAELFVYSDLPADSWRPILRRVLGVHGELRRHADPAVAVTREDAVEMYLTKTRQRLDQLAASDPEWAERLAAPSVTFNGRQLRNAPALLAELSAAPGRLTDGIIPGVVHGDLCFSNILFDFNNQIIRLIDPRGRFGRAGIFGDVRYDIAKLRHSVHGLYDFVMADMFHIAMTENAASGRVFANGVQARIAEAFDSLIRDAGYDLREIQTIEGLLFLSMLPLHGDHPRRQAMLYYTGLQLLDEVM